MALPIPTPAAVDIMLPNMPGPDDCWAATAAGGGVCLAGTFWVEALLDWAGAGAACREGAALPLDCRGILTTDRWNDFGRMGLVGVVVKSLFATAQSRAAPSSSPREADWSSSEQIALSASQLISSSSRRRRRQSIIWPVIDRDPPC